MSRSGAFELEHKRWRIRRTRPAPGLTVVETLVVVAIVVVLAGIVYAALGPARERARRAVCMGNFHQIGIAIAQYRADYGGRVGGGRLEYRKLGLPPTAEDLMAYMDPGYRPGSGEVPAVFRCPNNIQSAHTPSGYGYGVWQGRPRPDDPDFAEVVARRGGEYPLLWDDNHTTPRDKEREQLYVIVLRLGGRVEGRLVPRYVPSEEW